MIPECCIYLVLLVLLNRKKVTPISYQEKASFVNNNINTCNAKLQEIHSLNATQSF